MRASNADRERVAGLLQQAMAEGRLTVAELEARLDSVYAAKTMADLAPVIIDLPGHQVSLGKNAPTVQPVAQTLSVSGAGTATENMVAVLSGVKRKGRWSAPAHINAVAVMGGVELDFTRCTLSAGETVIDVTAIMGGVDIRVPIGMTVIVEGVGIMGAFQDHANQRYGPEAPVLRVRGLAIMGGVEVKSSKRQIGG